MHCLDLVSEHRDYCPWINALAQNGTAITLSRRTSLDGLAGWEALLRAVDARTLHRRHEHEHGNGNGNGNEGAVTARAFNDDGTASEVVSVAESTGTKEDLAVRDERDKERWAKLKRLKQAFHVKRRKGKGGAEVGKSKGSEGVPAT